VPAAADGETVAVNVTLSPVLGEVVEASSVVVVDIRLDEELTVMLTALDVLVA
jgi:hypothetical protein